MTMAAATAALAVVARSISSEWYIYLYVQSPRAQFDIVQAGEFRSLVSNRGIPLLCTVHDNYY